METFKITKATLVEAFASFFSRKILSLFFIANTLILFPLEGISQSRINGKIIDNSGNPIAFANVLLLSPLDSIIVKGCVSEDNGNFHLDKIDQNSYILSVSLLGYTNYLDKLEVKSNSIIDLISITLFDSEKELDGIQVTAQKPLYERQIDRLVINVQSSITSAGNTVLEVLQKSPGVMVNRQSNSIILNGKAGVTIMINNRIQRLPMEAIFQMMDGMSAANIEKIELITNPPAKYDAEGMGGIIHLITAQSADIGTNGNFGLTAGMNARETLGANFIINHRNEKFSFFVDYAILYDHNINVWENIFQIQNPDFVSSFHSIMDRPNKLTNQSFRSGFEFDMGSKTKVGTLVSASQRHYQMDASSVVKNQISTDSSNHGTIKIHELNVWNHFTSNIHLTHAFSPKSMLRLDLDYNRSKNNQPTNYQLDIHSPELNLSTVGSIDMTKQTPIHMKVVGLDYSFQPSLAFRFEAGVKGTFSDFTNEVEVFFNRDGSTIRDEELSVLAFLEEDILAGYISGEWIINENNQINGGLRFENTRTYVNTSEDKHVIDRDFGNFFPSIFYKKLFNKNLNVNLGYSRRIQRPSFQDLAPFVFLLDPNTFITGNPALLPAIIESIKTDINFKRANLSLEYSHANNQIAGYQPELDLINNRQIQRSQNFDYQKIYCINLSLPWIINDWWDVQLNSGSFYNFIKTSHLEENIIINFFNFQTKVTSNFVLPNDYSAELTGEYNSTHNWGIWRFSPMGSLNIGIQKKLNLEKGYLRLTFDDILYTSVFHGDASIPKSNMTNSLMWDPHMQSFRLIYTRNLGNKKLRGVNIKSGYEEFRERVPTK
jgi:outer membrane receptor protein involved in Fe transport